MLKEEDKIRINIEREVVLICKPKHKIYSFLIPNHHITQIIINQDRVFKQKHQVREWKLIGDKSNRILKYSMILLMY